MAKTILLIGLGNFGQKLAFHFQQMGHFITGIDEDEQRVNAALPYLNEARIGNSTSEEFLQSMGIDNYDLCIVTIANDFQSSLETTALLKDLGAHKVIARAQRDVHKRFLLNNGADEVVYPDGQAAKWVVMRYSADKILDYIELDNEHVILEVAVPKGWIGKSVGELDIRKKFDLNIMAVKENGKLNASVSALTVLTREATLMVVGKYKAMQRCFRV